MKEAFIEIKDLCKCFGSKQVLNRINLNVYKQDIFGIIGMSGAGKSTLLRCLATLDSPTSGSLSVGGDPLPQMDGVELQSIRKNIGVVFQHFPLFSSRTAADNIAYPLEIQGIAKEIRTARVNELLLLVGLLEKKDSYPSQLSGGEKQRIAIARAIATNPDLLLCDEPSSALDPETVASILQLLEQLNRTLGLTIVIITHQMEVVKQVCNRVAVLSQGQIIEEGEVSALFSSPKHPVTKRLLFQSGNREEACA